MWGVFRRSYDTMSQNEKSKTTKNIIKCIFWFFLISFLLCVRGEFNDIIPVCVRGLCGNFFDSHQIAGCPSK